MPELPEMETYRSLLTPFVVGKTITDTEVTREKTIGVPLARWQEVVPGNRIVALERHAKHLLFQLQDNHVLLLHLMLGGSMYWGSETDKLDRTAQVILSFGDERLYFIGLRLGYLHLLTNDEAQEKLAKLGPEPLAPAFTSDLFSQRLHTRRGVLKPVLVDQSFLSGIGNCYSDEICFTARIRPDRTIASLTEREDQALYQAIHSVFAAAIRYGGYMDSPFYSGDRLTGGFDPRCEVYDREGEPCVRCGQPIVRSEIGSRKVFYCPVCQH